MKFIAVLCSFWLAVSCNAADQWVTLDFTNPDASRIQIVERVSYGVTSKDFVPNSGFRVEKVTSGNVTLWDGKKEEWCASTHYHNRDEVHLLHLETKDGTFDESVCFEKNSDGSWKKIDKMVFQNKLKQISHGSATAYDMHDVKAQERKARERATK
ncbi:signal peptide containing protein [Theileria equi strain WA]|uniref:Signal peptide containing protein n=1 Tax=Theileria equi strain WA TaxID=1537102 RepID=L1L9W7_THEEQ|nr:signal peptide containing protein [Theileria equi strain WA]EKX71970.1 signal peptide containing protein [Theileria equi strain WA]|eukprot:XP_004831422.1 signal peptide containing protein [Theileria equi strain WA]